LPPTRDGNTAREGALRRTFGRHRAQGRRPYAADPAADDDSTTERRAAASDHAHTAPAHPSRILTFGVTAVQGDLFVRSPTSYVDAPFEVLGLDPDADESDIDRAYRRRVVETHPDQGGSTRAFQRVKAAYEAIMEGRVDAGESDDEDDPRRGRSRPDRSRVEYLDYAVIDDHDWALDDDDLFEKAAAADLDPTDHGEFLVEPSETLLQAAENRGFAWPYACRGGACANCAVAVVEGEMTMPIDHVLSTEMLDRGIQLSCIGAPTTAELKIVYNVKQMPDLDDLILPPYRFERARSVD
jgi:ferredoxin